MTVYAKSVFKNTELSIIVLESIECDIYRTTINTASVLGYLKSVAVVVCGSDGDYALDMDSNVVSIDTLRRQISTLDSIVNPLISPHLLSA